MAATMASRRRDLTACPLLLGLDDLQDTPNVERTHPQTSSTSRPACRNPPAGIRERRQRWLHRGAVAGRAGYNQGEALAEQLDEFWR